jgi:chemotaxis protein methyltransferase CheR
MAMCPVTDDLEEGRRLVESLAGIVLDSHALAAFAAAVEHGMTRMGIVRAAEYFGRLASGQAGEELERLLERAVNNETYFYREPRHFEVLSRLLAAGRSGGESPAEKVRVLSAGCSTGEEAYSIAASLLELARRLPGFDFEVVGVDISHSAVERARRGVYGPNSFRSDIARTRRDAWFEAVGERRYRPVGEVMRKVDFRPLNLNSGSSLRDALGGIDVAFCRNVLIHLNSVARARICRSLVSSLHDCGYLFIGTAETLPGGTEGITAQQLDGVFYWRKGEPEENTCRRPEHPAESPPSTEFVPGKTPQRPRREPAQPGARPVVEPIPRGHGRDSALHPTDAQDRLQAWYAEASRLIGEDRGEDALAILGEVIGKDPDNVDACRLLAELHVDRTDFESALLFCDRGTKVDEALAWPWVLRGRICHYEGDAQGAQRALKKAIYYQPNYWPAHFYLAEVYKRLGEVPLAVRAYRNALRNLARKEAHRDSAAACIGYSRADVIVTCQNNIRSLADDRRWPQEVKRPEATG